MRNVISIERLKETATYKNLVAKKEIIKIGFLEKRATREIISNGFEVFKNKGSIPGNVTGTNLQIVKDLIEMEINNIQVDYSNVMTCEKLSCGNPNPPCSPNMSYGMLSCCNCSYTDSND